MFIKKPDVLQILLFYNAASNAAGLRAFIAVKQFKKKTCNF